MVFFGVCGMFVIKDILIVFLVVFCFWNDVGNKIGGFFIFCSEISSALLFLEFVYDFDS